MTAKMMAHHKRNPSLSSHHTRNASVSSDIHLTETVSSLPRFVCGNVLRSQRQLMRAALCLLLLVIVLYLLGPYQAPVQSHSSHKEKTHAVREVTTEDPPASEYRATFFEEMGKRFARKERLHKPVVLFPGNNLLPLANEGTVKEASGKNRTAQAGKASAVSDGASELDALVAGFSKVPDEVKTIGEKVKTIVDDVVGKANLSGVTDRAKTAANDVFSKDDLHRLAEKLRGVDGGFDKADILKLAEKIRTGAGGDFSREDLYKVADRVKAAAVGVSQCHKVPGMAVVMVKGGESVTLPLGLADVDTGRSMTSDTKFLLTSVSATFLGQLLAVLIGQSSKNVTWDTSVAIILGPDFQLATAELTKAVTLKDLLSQRSGLASGDLALHASFPVGWNRTHVVRHLKHLPVSPSLHGYFQQSIIGVLLAAHVAEVMGGAPLAKLMADHLLTPLGMQSTSVVTSPEQLKMAEFSRLYVPQDGSLVQVDSNVFDLGPLTEIFLLASTASDMTRWLTFTLHQGQLSDGRQLISRDLWQSMWQRLSELPPLLLGATDKGADRWPVEDRSQGFGLSWFINKYRGVSRLWQAGGLYSHYSLTWLFPQKDAALWVAVNGCSGDSRPTSVLESVAYLAADLLLGSPPWVDEASLCTYPAPWGTDGQGDGGIGNVTRRGGEGGENSSAGQERGSEAGGTSRQEDQGGLVVADKRDNQTSIVAPALSAGKVESALSAIGESAPAAEPPRLQAGIGTDSAAIVMDAASMLPLKSYQGVYRSPLFGDVFVTLNHISGGLDCRLNTMTGILNPRGGHSFGLELSGSLKFLSRPSKGRPAQEVFTLTFVVSGAKEVTAVGISDSSVTGLPITFQKIA